MRNCIRAAGRKTCNSYKSHTKQRDPGHTKSRCVIWYCAERAAPAQTYSAAGDLNLVALSIRSPIHSKHESNIEYAGGSHRCEVPYKAFQTQKRHTFTLAQSVSGSIFFPYRRVIKEQIYGSEKNKVA